MDTPGHGATLVRKGCLAIVTPKAPGRNSEDSGAIRDEIEAIRRELRPLLIIGDVTRVVIDFRRTLGISESAHLDWVLIMFKDVGRWGARLAICNVGLACDHPVIALLVKIVAVEDTLDDAIARLEADLPEGSHDPGRWERVPPIEGAGLKLVGCPERDLVDVPGILKTSGFEVREADQVEDGDHVVFCISCVDGPTEGSERAVLRCAGRTLVPVAIVLTHASVIDDDSLREFVTCQEMDLLSRILPVQEVDRLLLLHDFDPYLAGKIRDRMHQGAKPILCLPG